METLIYHPSKNDYTLNGAMYNYLDITVNPTTVHQQQLFENHKMIDFYQILKIESE